MLELIIYITFNTENNDLTTGFVDSNYIDINIK